MPMPSRLKLPPLPTGPETFGERLARIRKERGITQVKLAEKTCLTQGLISDYERDRLRLNAEMIVRLALALSVSADELLGLKPLKGAVVRDREGDRLWRRFHQVRDLSERDQRAIMRMINALMAAKGNSAHHTRARAAVGG